MSIESDSYCHSSGISQADWGIHETNGYRMWHWQSQLSKDDGVIQGSSPALGNMGTQEVSWELLG